MVVRQGFLSFFICSSRFLSRWWSAKLYSKLNMVLNTCVVLRGSSILHLAFLSAMLLPYLLRWCYIILDNFLHVSWFICCQEWGILNPSISSLELSWYRFHLKPSLRNVAIFGAYQWSEFSPILSAEAVFISSLISSEQLFSLESCCHLSILRCFP